MPRILAILFAAFLSLFALDVFGEGYGFWGTIFALFMHLIPSIIVPAALVIAWRWEAVGGILFLAVAAWNLVTTLNHLDWCLFISGPPFLTGGLFLTDLVHRASRQRSA
jgi:hypothetical protein